MRISTILLLLALILSFSETAMADLTIDSYKSEIDSLKNVLKTQTLTERDLLEIYNGITSRYAAYEIDSVFVYAPKSLDLARKLKNNELEIGNCSHLGIAYCFRDNYDSAFIWLDKAKELAEKTRNTLAKVSVIEFMAFAYARQGKYLSAIDFYTQSLKVLDESGSDETKYLGALLNLAELYRNLNNPEMAIQYLTKAEELCNKIKSLRGKYEWNITQVYNEYAFNYLKQGNLDKANDYALKSDSINREGFFVINKCQTQGLLASICLQRNDLDRALSYAKASYDQAAVLKDNKLYAYSGKILSDVYLAQKRYPEAEAEALKIWQTDSTDIDGARAIALNIALANISMGNKEKAASYLQKYSELNARYSEKSFQTTVSDITIKYETEKKEMQIASLKKQRILYIVISIAGFLLAVIVGLVSRQKMRHERLESELISTNAILDWEVKERERFADELHDGVNGMLSALRTELNSTGYPVKNIVHGLDECIENIRRIAYDRSPGPLERFGMKAAIEDRCCMFPNVHFHFFGTERRVEKKIERVVFYCACELVNNSFKHSEAENINVQLIQGEKHVSLTVQDDGRGFNKEIVRQGSGLRNLSDRVLSCNGKMDVISSPGNGTETIIELKVES